jgi:hypothetical protein
VLAKKSLKMRQLALFFRLPVWKKSRIAERIFITFWYRGVSLLLQFVDTFQFWLQLTAVTDMHISSLIAGVSPVSICRNKCCKESESYILYFSVHLTVFEIIRQKRVDAPEVLRYAHMYVILFKHVKKGHCFFCCSKTY